MGLVQRALEAGGLVTVCLSPIPDLTAAVGVPRLAGVEHPPGRPFGPPGDADTQTAVLRAALALVDAAREPGERVDLPFTWPGPRGRARGAPPVPPPIAALLKSKPWLVPRLVNRDPP